jgi:hypothetical protein
VPPARRPAGPRPAAPPTQAPARANTTRGKSPPKNGALRAPISKGGGTRCGGNEFPAAAPRRENRRSGPALNAPVKSGSRQRRGPQRTRPPDTAAPGHRPRQEPPSGHAPPAPVLGKRSTARAGPRTYFVARTNRVAPLLRRGSCCCPSVGKKSSAQPAPRAEQRIFTTGQQQQSQSQIQSQKRRGKPGHTPGPGNSRPRFQFSPCTPFLPFTGKSRSKSKSKPATIT